MKEFLLHPADETKDMKRKTMTDKNLPTQSVSSSSIQVNARRRFSEYVQLLLNESVCTVMHHKQSATFLSAYESAVRVLTEKVGVRPGFIIGRPTWDFPVGTLEFEDRDQTLLYAWTGLWCIGTFKTSMSLHTVYAMGDFPRPGEFLVGVGKSFWTPEEKDTNGSNLVTCTIKEY